MLKGARTITLDRCFASGRWSYLLMVVLATCFWWPALWEGRLLIHGDSAIHGLPLVWLHGQMLAGHDTVLWSNRVYGGHPLFAEGHGGYANPLNWLAALFDPAHAIGFLHWATMVIGGCGVVSLCRVLGISRWSSVFAGIAVMFSGAWISSHHDLTEFDTVAWVPWLLVAAEYWLRQPSPVRSASAAIALALLIFSGYPQMAHGAVLYALVSLLPSLLARKTHKPSSARRSLYVTSALLAIMLAMGLSAIQLFPLLELTGQSYRQQGVPMMLDGAMPLLFYLRGLPYAYFGTDFRGIGAPGLGNVVVLILSGLFVFFRMPARIWGHFFGMILLFNLAMGPASPLFWLVYKYHLIPGLHYFRIMLPYGSVAVIGFAVLAAYFLDVLAGQLLPALYGCLQRQQRMLLWLLVGAYAGGFTWICHTAYSALYTPWVFLPLFLIVLFTVLLHITGRQASLPSVATLILAIEILALHLHPFPFHDRLILSRPEVVDAIAAEPDVQEYHTMCHSVRAAAMVIIDPEDSRLPQAYRRSLAALSPYLMAMLWQIPSINGVAPLPLARRNMLDPVFLKELIGAETNRPGLRLMDILAVRYISADGLFPTPGLRVYWQDLSEDLFIYRNDYAKPRFQVYWDAEAVDKPEQALEGLKAARSEQLFVERRRGESPPPTGGCATCAAVRPAVEVTEATAMRYRVKVDMPQEGWLFLADAYYPGWEATVNGAKRPVYAAQVLGKAVHLDAGRNEVTIRYVPRMFYIGAAVSAITLLAVVLILLRRP